MEDIILAILDVFFECIGQLVLAGIHWLLSGKPHHPAVDSHRFRENDSSAELHSSTQIVDGGVPVHGSF
jgi:hypothetical protein